MEEIFKLKQIQKHFAEQMGTDELCCQTAEELSELAQALMRFRRAKGHGQPTDVDVPQALHSIAEEVTDVIICLKELVYMIPLEYDTLEYIEDRKIKRTAKRYGMAVTDD